MPRRPRFGVLIRAVAPSRESRPTPTGHPAETGCRAASGSSTLRACGAGRLALEQIRQRGLQRPWANPRTCARGCRRGSRSYPQARCTNLTPSCAQAVTVKSYATAPPEGVGRAWGAQQCNAVAVVPPLPCCPVAAWATQRPAGGGGRAWGAQQCNAVVVVPPLPCCPVALLQRGLRNAPPEVGDPSLARNSATPWQSYRRCPVALLHCCSVGYATPRRRWVPEPGTQPKIGRLARVMPGYRWGYQRVCAGQGHLNLGYGQCPGVGGNRHYGVAASTGTARFVTELRFRCTPPVLAWRR